MRQYKIAAISIAVVVLLVISFFFVKEMVINNTPHKINKLNATLTNYQSTDIEDIEVFNNGSKFVFQKRDEESIAENGEKVTKRMWYIVGEEEITIDQDILDTLAIIIANMTAKDVIETETKDITKYGFDDKSTYIMGKVKNGETFKLTLGDMLYNRDGYYIMKNDDTTVYATSLYSANAMLITRGQLLDTNIFPGTLSDVTSFSLTKNNEKVFTIEPSEIYYWIITEPIKFRCDAPKTDAMVNNTFKLMVKEYVDIAPEDISVYGLDKPSYELTIISKGIETKLILGKENIRDDSFYAMVKDKSEVFSIDSTTLNFVDTPALGIIWPFPYTPKLEYVHTVDIKVAGRKMLFEKKFSEEYKLDEYIFNGESIIDIDKTLRTFGQFYYSIVIGSEITDIIPKATITGKPYCEMVFTYSDGNSEKMEYYVTDYDKTKLYVVRNDEYTGLITNIEFFDDKNGLAAITDLILSGDIQRDLEKKKIEDEKQSNN